MSQYKTCATGHVICPKCGEHIGLMTAADLSGILFGLLNIFIQSNMVDGETVMSVIRTIGEHGEEGVKAMFEASPEMDQLIQRHLDKQKKEPDIT